MPVLRPTRGVRPGEAAPGMELGRPSLLAEAPGGAPGPSVLVVEDEACAGCGLASCLREEGYGATPVEVAALAASASAVELILVDMDSRSGPAALDELASLPPEARRRVLLVSAEADRWMAECSALQCYGIVDRELGELHLLTAVADALWQTGSRS